MEIERKWLVDRDRIPYDLSELPSQRIEQAYIAFSPTIRVRSIDDGSCYVMTVKSHYGCDGDLSRSETEFPISEEEYRNLLPLVQGNTVSKTRYRHMLASGLTEEIDVFSGPLNGLAYLEIEFPDEETARAYPMPDWVKKDVTLDHRYANSSLAQFGLPE